MHKKDLDDLIRELYEAIEETENEPVVTSSSTDDGYYHIKYNQPVSASSNSIWAPNTSGGAWTVPNTIQGGSTTGGNTWTNGSWTTITYPPAVGENEEAWPKVDDALGVAFVDGDEIKLKTKNGKEVTIARLDDSEDFIPIEVIAAKKKLIEEADSEVE